jgi:hypothetical protein
VLVDRGGSLRVAAIIHGPSGAICASPAEVASVVANRAWLDYAVTAQSNRNVGARGMSVLAGIALLGTAAWIGFVRWRRLEACRRVRGGCKGR